MMEENIYLRAVKAFGEDLQMIIAMEECGELISCISHVIRGRKNYNDLAKEIADVEIMCSQLRLLVGGVIVDREKDEKLKRLSDLLAEKNTNEEG